MKSRPLAGRRIVVTRPREQAAGLATAIREAGGEVILLPAIEIRDVADTQGFESIVQRLEQFAFAIFISPTAARKALELLRRFRGMVPLPAGLQVVGIGAGTLRALVAAGVSAVIAPQGPADSEALLALPEFQQVSGKGIVVFRGAGGRELLGETLVTRGARVEYAECYLRARPSMDPAVQATILAHDIDAFAVSSGEGLANLSTMLGEAGRDRLLRSLLLVPHERVAQQARELGVQRVTVAGPADAEVLAALVAYFGGEAS